MLNSTRLIFLCTTHYVRLISQFGCMEFVLKCSYSVITINKYTKKRKRMNLFKHELRNS